MKKTVYQLDKRRYGEGRLLLIFESGLRFVYVLRRCQVSRNPFWLFILYHMRMKYGLEISPKVDIGPGFYIGHAFDITINPNVTIGKNVNIHRGVVIGQENRGSRKGVPTIHDRVWIGSNAVIVGNIEIGSDVLIAPNSYVNCDVPSHSIVIGNPCKVVSRHGATDGYIENEIII